MFGWFLRVPSLHALVFIENLFVTLPFKVSYSFEVPLANTILFTSIILRYDHFVQTKIILRWFKYSPPF